MTKPPAQPRPDTVVLVDDDPNLLAALRRSIGRVFNVLTAERPADALKLLAQSGPVAVLVSDMSMPEMSGVDLILRARETHPHTTYILLTGNSDQQTAVDAVNRAHIFRFLNKPCPREVLELAIRDGIELYRLRNLERELLQKTLTGSIAVLIQILQMARPRLFRQGDRIRKAARAIAERLNYPDLWCVEIAAMLSSIGCITLPDDIVEAALQGRTLTDDERRLYDAHPNAGADLLKRIPRLEAASEIVRLQDLDDAALRERAKDDNIRIAAQIVRVVRDVDLALTRSEPIKASFERLATPPGRTDPAILQAAESLASDIFRAAAGGDIRKTLVRKLIIGMVLQEDIRTKDGELLISAGHEVTDALLARIRNYALRGLTQEEVTVLIPKNAPKHAVPDAA
ncbi:MAG: HD domain-containing phosphohydrolase [Phycisphaerales bacterium]